MFEIEKVTKDDINTNLQGEKEKDMHTSVTLIFSSFFCLELSTFDSLTRFNYHELLTLVISGLKLLRL